MLKHHFVINKIMFTKVHLCWYKYDMKLKLLISTQNIFLTSEFSDDPSSFIIGTFWYI